MNTFSYCLNNPTNLVDYTGRKPGDLFSTVDEAAIDACLYMGPDSFSNSWEYGTVIYSVETTIYVRCRRIYTYRKSDGSMGKVARIDIVEKKVIRYTYSVVRTDNNDRRVFLPLPPEGHARAGFVHTHPTGVGRGVTIFSPADKNFAQNMRPIYVYGPNGHIIKYDPVMDEVIPIGEDFPESPYLDSFLEG